MDLNYSDSHRSYFSFLGHFVKEEEQELPNMWDRRKGFLAAICFSALFYRVTAGRGELLVSALDVVDDLYTGCRKQALERFVYSGLLKQELNNSVLFHTAWMSDPKCTVPKSEGQKDQMHALSAYLNGEEYFSKAFDKEVKTMGVNVSTYENHFHFKCFHFLLMDAITMLNPPKCRTVFVIQEDDELDPPPKGATVRFGSFTRVSSSLQELKKWADLDDRVLLNITSCFFVDLGKHNCSKDNDVVLLSPAEEFTVEKVTEISEEDSVHKEVVLTHLQLNSTKNCFAFPRSAAVVSTLCPVLAFVILSSLYLPTVIF